jgi:AraC-like DNA-binding protein
MAAGTLTLRHYGASHGSHAHDHFQVLIGLDGVLELEVDGRGRRIAAGDGCVIPPGERHDFSVDGRSQCLVLDSTLSAWQRHAGLAAPSPHAHALAQCLAHSVTQDHPLATLYGPLLLLEAWQKTSTPRSARRPIDWAALAAWAATRHDASLDVAALAARCCLSASQFNARCRIEMGMSAMHWLRGLRLAQARMLRDAGTSVAETARRTGYRSPSALTAALRRQAQPDG